MNTQESQGNDLLLDSNRTGTKTVMHLHSLSWPDLKSTAIVLVVGGRRPLPSVDAMLYVGTWGWWKVWLPHFPKLPPLSSSNRPQLACSSFLDEPLFLPCVSALLLTSLWNRRSTRSSIITRCSVYLDTIHWMCNSISVHPSIATTAHHSREHSSPIHIQARPSHKLISCLCWVVDPEICPLFNSSHSWIYRVTTIYWLLDLIKNTFVRVFVPLPQDKTNPEPRETMNAQWQSVWVSSSRAVTLKQFEGTTSPQLLLLLVIDWTSPRTVIVGGFVFRLLLLPKRSNTTEERLIALFWIQIPKFHIVCGWRTFEVNVVGCGKKGVCGRSEKSLCHNYMFLVHSGLE